MRIAPAAARSQALAGELNRGAEEVVALGHWFAGAYADADVDWVLGDLVVRLEGALDCYCEIDCLWATEANEAMMPSPVCFTSLPPTATSSVADDAVVGVEELHRLRVAEALGDVGRSDDVGEEDGAERVVGVGFTDGM